MYLQEFPRSRSLLRFFPFLRSEFLWIEIEGRLRCVYDRDSAVYRQKQRAFIEDLTLSEMASNGGDCAGNFRKSSASLKTSSIIWKTPTSSFGNLYSSVRAKMPISCHYFRVCFSNVRFFYGFKTVAAQARPSTVVPSFSRKTRKVQAAIFSDVSRYFQRKNAKFLERGATCQFPDLETYRGRICNERGIVTTG